MEIKKENRLAVQSKQWLLNALLQLMREKNYSDITIKELTKRADLDRKTFYRHFKTKDEILILPIKEAFDTYIEQLKKIPILTSYEVIHVYFNLCLQNIDFFKLLNKHNLLLLMLIKLTEYLPMLNDIFLDNSLYRKKTVWELTYEAGGIWNATVRWISNGAKETPEEMAKMISSFATPIETKANEQSI